MGTLVFADRSYHTIFVIGSKGEGDKNAGKKIPFGENVQSAPWNVKGLTSKMKNVRNFFILSNFG